MKFVGAVAIKVRGKDKYKVKFPCACHEGIWANGGVVPLILLLYSCQNHPLFRALFWQGLMAPLAGLDILEMTELFFPCQEWNPESSILCSSLYTDWPILAGIKTERNWKEQSIQHLRTTFTLLCHDLLSILFSPSTQALTCIDVYSWEQLWP